jgi:hypothetical protein
MKCNWFSTALAVACCCLTTTSFAGVIGVEADTWVREDSPTSNRNNDAFMNARTDSDGTTNDVMLLRFNLASKTGPTTASNLILTWQRSDGSTGKTLSLWGVNDGTADDTSWGETTVNYNNAPGMNADGVSTATEVTNGNTDADIHDLDAANLTLLVANLAYGPQVEGAAYAFASGALDSFLDADSNGIVTFLITRNSDPSSNQARFMTREATAFASGAAAPVGGAGAYLDGITTIPEPASFGLLGLSALAMVLRRQR